MSRLGNGENTATVSHTRDLESRVAYAKKAIEQLARQAVADRSSGTIGIEIPVKDGVLGRVKRLIVDFQPE
ncbi:MAG: hypothetical protein ACOY3P_02435 [Planctomycetota bacterium]